MHVILTVAEMGSGGAEAVASSLARDLLASGDQVTVASHGGWRTAALEREGARLVSVPLRGRRPRDLARVVLALRRERARTPVDLVHAHNVKSAAVSAAAVSAAASPRRSRVPVLVTLHGVPDNKYRSAARILLRCADEVVAVSSDVAERITAVGFPSSRIRVIENAVAVPKQHDRDEARARLGLSRDALVVLCAARLVPQKRHDLLVTAWCGMPPNALLLVAGEGIMRPAIEAAIRQSGQAHRILMLGERHDVDWLLAAADVLVLPTDWEGLPVSVLEAMAVGIPVVASAVTGVAPLGSDAVELVRAESSTALAAGLQRVLFDGERRRDMVAAGAAMTCERFSSERMWAQYRELYERHCFGLGTRRAARIKGRP